MDQDTFEDYIEMVVGEENKRKKTSVNVRTCDVVIIGGGPAGLTAGLYCSRAKRETVLLEAESLGGQVRTTHRIENYPGFLEGNAVKLIENMEKCYIRLMDKFYNLIWYSGTLKQKYQTRLLPTSVHLCFLQ